ncbi:MAG: hypothetical protein ACREP9_07155, partial [Candidatus Dormibacteraceae bacterium]
MTDERVQTETPGARQEVRGSAPAPPPPSAGSVSPLSDLDMESSLKAPAHRRKKWLVAAVIVIVVVASIFLYRHYAGWESTDDAEIDGYINPVSSRVAGYITQVTVDNNASVKAGT